MLKVNYCFWKWDIIQTKKNHQIKLKILIFFGSHGLFNWKSLFISLACAIEADWDTAIRGIPKTLPRPLDKTLYNHFNRHIYNIAHFYGRISRTHLKHFFRAYLCQIFTGYVPQSWHVCFARTDGNLRRTQTPSNRFLKSNAEQDFKSGFQLWWKMLLSENFQNNQFIFVILNFQNASHSTAAPKSYHLDIIVCSWFWKIWRLTSFQYFSERPNLCAKAYFLNCSITNVKTHRVPHKQLPNVSSPASPGCFFCCWFCSKFYSSLFGCCTLLRLRNFDTFMSCLFFADLQIFFLKKEQLHQRTSLLIFFCLGILSRPYFLYLLIF